MNGEGSANAAFATLAQVSATLLAVVIALVAFIPTLVELVRSRSPKFFAGEGKRRQLRAGLTYLQLAIVMLTAACLLAIAGFFWQPPLLLVVTSLSLVVGVILFLAAGLTIAWSTRSLV